MFEKRSMLFWKKFRDSNNCNSHLKLFHDSTEETNLKTVSQKPNHSDALLESIQLLYTRQITKLSRDVDYRQNLIDGTTSYVLLMTVLHSLPCKATMFSKSFFAPLPRHHARHGSLITSSFLHGC